MLTDLVNTLCGSIPEEFEFLKIFVYGFIFYIFLSMFKLFIDVCKSFMRF